MDQALRGLKPCTSDQESPADKFRGNSNTEKTEIGTHATVRINIYKEY